MCKTFAYMRISTKEERGKQKFTRQEQAIERWCKECDSPASRIISVTAGLPQFPSIIHLISELLSFHYSHSKSR